MTIDPELQEEGLSSNKKFLLALMSLAKGKVEQFARLRIAVYMLKNYGLHTYKFEGRCPLGYGDPDFHEDLNTLGVYINYDVFEGKDKNPHRFYELNELGKSYGKEFANETRKGNPNRYKRLREIAELLSNPDWTAIKLYERSKKTALRKLK